MTYDVANAVIDPREIDERITELEHLSDIHGEHFGEEPARELADLIALRASVTNRSGRDWDSAILVRADHFEDYARDQAEDVYGEGAVALGSFVDWPAYARRVAGDYQRVEFDGATYLFR
jgi:hypothetical protein